MLIVTQYYIIIKIKKTKTSRKALKKVGIMRINSYNKFFAKVAEIMNTSIKAVKQLDGRYKVELANHVHLNVYRGVGGCLFVHDHRGIANITSCYDFDDFKTIKDLYDRLVSDYSESAERDVMEVKQELNSRFGKEQCVDTDTLQPIRQIIAKIEDINYCPNQNTCGVVSPYVHCDYNYKSEACIKAHKNFNHYCEQVHKHLKAINNPEWHKVSLAKLATIDNDMLDEKRKLVRSINQILKDGIRNLYKCENHIAYEALERYVLRKCDELIRHNHLKPFWFSYIARQLAEVSSNTIYLYAPYTTAHRNR